MRSTQPNPIEVYTLDEFCKACSISRSLFYSLQKQSKGPPTIKLGRKILIKKDAADKWLESIQSIS